MKKILAVILALALVPALFACGEKPDAEPRGKAYFAYFDTVSYVYSYAGDSEEQFESRAEEVARILEEYHRLFDIYHEYSGMNNLCTVNRLAGGEPVKVDKRLVDFMLYAKELYDMTGGEMNALLGAVLSLWHDCRETAENGEGESIPTEEELKAAAGHVDFSLLEIDEENMTLRLSDAEASIDVGALGKGYATERAAEYLEGDGAAGYVLNVGGNIRIIGTKPDGSGWVTGVREPNGGEQRFAVSLLLSDTACVTSGIYERYFTVDGVRYHHIIDKDTLFPSVYYSSVTVVTKDSALADALSTALFCMPIDDGKELIESLEDAQALWIFPDEEIEYSAGLAELMIEE